MAANTGVRSCHATLVAATEDTFDLTLDAGFDRLEIANSGTHVAYYRLDGTAAVAAADETRSLLGGERQTVPVNGDRTCPTVRVISAGTPTIHVEAF